MLPFTFASPPKTKQKKAPHRFAILRLTIANLKREDEYSLEVQREYLESFADREGHPHSFTGMKLDMGMTPMVSQAQNKTWGHVRYLKSIKMLG